MKSGFVGILLACCAFAQPAEAESKKLKVFILSGQSNMVGHANGHTMGTLFKADGPKEVSVAQRAAAALPEFKGNAVAMESYTEYALDSLAVFNAGWQQNLYEWDLVGSNRPYHYLGSGKFFVRLGDAFATDMAGMMKP